MIDAHCHLHLSSDVSGGVERARNAGVTQVVVNATGEQDWNTVLGLYETYRDFVVPCIGVHPWYCTDLQADWELRLEETLARFPHALLGEVGLDHYNSK